jgi:hypothetical protein
MSPVNQQLFERSGQVEKAHLVYRHDFDNPCLEVVNLFVTLAHSDFLQRITRSST